MATLRIEMDRGHGWELRAEGPFDNFPGTVASLDGPEAHIRAALIGYAIQYPHRALLDGALVAEVAPRHVAR